MIENSYISLHGLRFYAYHGVGAQERRVGAYFTVDLRVGYPLARAAETDDVADTLNYAELFALVEREMAQPSNLLEHVAGRIIRSIERTFSDVSTIDITVTKENPPMGADSRGASVELHCCR